VSNVFPSLSESRTAEVTAVGNGSLRVLRVLREAYSTKSPPDHDGFASALISHDVIFRELEPVTATLPGRRLRATDPGRQVV
jgi:hypothetical protein